MDVRDNLEKRHPPEAKAKYLQSELLHTVELVGEDDEVIVGAQWRGTVPFNALVEPLSVRCRALAPRVETERVFQASDAQKERAEQHTEMKKYRR